MALACGADLTWDWTTLNEKGHKIFKEIFEVQKKRIYNALLNSSSQEVLNFDEVLKRIINE